MPLHTVTEKRLELARKSALDRLARNIDDAIIACALDLRIEPEALVESHISATKERLGSLGLKLNDTRYGRPNEAVLDAVKREAPTHETLIDAAMRRWNENAAALDARFARERLPKPFPIRLSPAAGHGLVFTNLDDGAWDRGVEILLFVSVQERLKAKSMREDIPFAKDDIEAAEKQADTYDWMLDALTMLLATPKGIERLASGRNSRWERKLRKTKQGVAMKRLAFQRDLELARSEVERERLIKEFCRDIRAHHDETERQIRLDRNYKDFVLSRWIHRWELGTPQPIENAQSGDKSG